VGCELALHLKDKGLDLGVGLGDALERNHGRIVTDDRRLEKARRRPVPVEEDRPLKGGDGGNT
jgi:hypothetical protein